MAWHVVMDEECAITLPTDLIAKLGWTPETRLCMTFEDDRMTLAAADEDDAELLP